MVGILIWVATFLAQGTSKVQAPRGVSVGQQSQSDLAAREALAAFNRGDWEAAANGYDKLARLSPGVAAYHLNLGIAYYSSGRPHDAVQPLRQALRLKPILALARY